MAGETSRSDEFKRATAGALRAMAGSDEVQVSYQPGAAGLVGKRARLPSPTRALPPGEMARLRGLADAV
ncbi:MAG TPA: cobaltochelatase subunit CobT, partial [Acidiphilium sp.]